MTFKVKPAFQNLGNWVKGTIEFDEKRDLTFCAKVYEEPSEIYGINGGKISKLEIRLGKETLANYDRGWDVEVAEEAEGFYGWILANFN
jgi:hypothetical protein